MISVIIPVYNEEKTIGKVLDKLAVEQEIEIIIVDGQSTDKTSEIIRKYPVKHISTTKGRAQQLNEGAKIATGEGLLFLHADCFLEDGSIEKIEEVINDGCIGGCLSQKIDSKRIIYRFIEASGNIRANISKIFYGDQAIFIRRDTFTKLGGFDAVELFDDVSLSKKMKRVGKTCLLNKRVYTSARRWEQQGIVKTTFINWLVSIGFMIRVPTKTLGKIYKDIR